MMRDCRIEIGGLNEAEAKCLSELLGAILRANGYTGKKIEVWQFSTEPSERGVSRQIFPSIPNPRMRTEPMQKIAVLCSNGHQAVRCYGSASPDLRRWSYRR